MTGQISLKLASSVQLRVLIGLKENGCSPSNSMAASSYLQFFFTSPPELLEKFFKTLHMCSSHGLVLSKCNLLLLLKWPYGDHLEN